MTIRLFFPGRTETTEVPDDASRLFVEMVVEAHGAVAYEIVEEANRAETEVVR